MVQTSAGQRERLLTATDRINKTGDRIQQGRQQLLETEVGASWLGCRVLRAKMCFAAQVCEVQSTGTLLQLGPRCQITPAAVFARQLCSASGAAGLPCHAASLGYNAAAACGAGCRA